MTANHKMSIPPKVILIVLVILGLQLGFGLQQYFSHERKKTGPPAGNAVPPPAKPLSDFRLIDPRGRPFTLANLKNRWSFVFFGYMNCPDVCPTTLGIMQQVWHQLRTSKADMKQLQMIFISVDPERDQPQQLQDYVAYFDPAFIGVSGDPDEIDKLANQTGILYGYEDADEETGNYIVNHSVQILLLDPQARLQTVLSPPFDSATIVRKLQSIRDNAGKI